MLNLYWILGVMGLAGGALQLVVAWKPSVGRYSLFGISPPAMGTRLRVTWGMASIGIGVVFLFLAVRG